MDYKIIFYFILLQYMVAAYVGRDNDYSNYEDEYENTLSIDEHTKESEAVTIKPLSRYDVTEIVIDIPDNRTRGPIITNFTITKPINLAQTTTPVSTAIDNNNNTDNNNTDNNNTDNTNNPGGDKGSERETLLDIIKDYLHEIKKGIVDGFNSLVHKKGKSSDLDAEDDFDSYTGSVSVISKLQKAANLAHKFPNTLFGHKFDDIF